MCAFVYSTMWCRGQENVCFLCLVRKRNFLISQEMLELNREPLRCLSLCTAGSDPLLQLKVIDWELGWEQESGVLHSVRSQWEPACQDAFLQMAYCDGRDGTAATQIHPANDILLQKRGGANHALHRTANGRRFLTQPLAEALWLLDLGTALQNCIPAETAFSEFVSQHNSHPCRDSFPSNNNAIVNYQCKAGELRALPATWSSAAGGESA